jgi:hypothetical protein
MTVGPKRTYITYNRRICYAVNMCDYSFGGNVSVNYIDFFRLVNYIDKSGTLTLSP